MQMVRILVEQNKVNVDATDIHGFYALHYAAWSNRAALINYFVKKCKDQVDKTRYGF